MAYTLPEKVKSIEPACKGISNWNPGFSLAAITIDGSWKDCRKPTSDTITPM